MRTRGTTRMARRAISLIVALLLLCSSQIAGALAYFDAAPRGTIGVSRPTISQQFILGQGESIKRATMWVDGVRVEPSWTADGLVTYTPPGALAAGTHTVRLMVEVSAGSTGLFYDPVSSTFSFTVAAGAVEVPSRPGPEELRALAWVNRYRAQAGLPAMTYNQALGAASWSHAAYLARHPDQQETNAHGEQPGMAGFSGTHSGERAQYWGYTRSTAEVINFTDRAEAAIDGWMDTIYHRIPLLFPGNLEMGYGLAGAGGDYVNVLVAGPGGDNAGTVLWPYPDQTGVPTGWDGLESPDPFRLYPGVKGPVGYTITMTFGGRVNWLNLDSATLTGPDGKVPVMTFDPKNDSHLSDTVAMIPYAPLAPGARYTATMAGTVDGRRFSRTWSFTTATEQVPDVRRMTSRTLGGELQSVGLDGSGFSAGARVFLGGLPVENVQVISSDRLTFIPPAGLGDGDHDMLLVTAAGREVLWRSFIQAGQMQLPGGTAFTEVPLLIHGVPYRAPARVHRTGTVLLPEGALADLGAVRSNVAAIGRTYWTWFDKVGDYTFGRVVSTVADRMLLLGMPVQEAGGQAYVDREFVTRLTGTPTVLANGQASLGLRDIGTHWARPQILQLLREGIVSGTGDGLYQPEGTLTRAAFVKMLTQVRGLTPLPGETGGFHDTSAHWVAAQGYVGAAVKAGVVLPAEYAGLRFEPEKPITREEMAVMVARALGRDAEARTRQLPLVSGAVTLDGKRFTDAATWSRPGYVAVAVEQGIITGYPQDGGTFTFGAHRQATRAEAAVMIVRTLGK